MANYTKLRRTNQLMINLVVMPGFTGAGFQSIMLSFVTAILPAGYIHLIVCYEGEAGS